MKYLPYLLPILLFTSCNPTGVDEQLLQSMIQSQEQAARVMEEQNEVVVRNLAKILEDDAKRRYRPIKTAIDSMQTYLNTFRDQIDATSAILADLPGKAVVELPTTLQLSHEIPARLLEFKRNYYRVQADSVALTQEEAANRIQNMQEQFSQYNLSLPENGLNSALAQRCWLSKLRSDIAGIESILVNSMAELSGGRMISCYFGFHPRVYRIHDNSDGYLENTYAIWVNTYDDLSVSRENINLYVNGEEVMPMQGIFTLYQPKEGRIDDKLSLDGYYFNTFTGERTPLFWENPLIIDVDE